MSLDSLRILVVMANNIGDGARDQDVFNFEDESDDEFGLPEFRIHLADSLTPAVLRDWTAADFASIYVRFRPHLERHAKKFLRNPSQVEEVVQEAFLYLMTTLPELDSELGVLRFLKWKTRLLALDVIRANSKVTLAPIEESPDLASNDPELSQDLERAEDAGIVALALSKIQPRHREAIIATLYEEKSAEVVAAQMGLSENAFRQLLFRARSAFRKALVGEAETKGKSISEILSIAARKAAAESGKYISAAGAFLLILAVSIGVLPNLSAPVQEQVISGPATSPTQEPEETVAEPSTETAEQSVPTGEVAAEEPSVAQPASEPTTQVETVSAIVESSSSNAELASEPPPMTSNDDFVDRSPFDPWLIDPILEEDLSPSFTSLWDGQTGARGYYTVATNVGLWADVTFQPNGTVPFESVRIGFIAGQDQFFANLEQVDYWVEALSDHDRYVFIGEVREITDVFGKSSTDSRMSGQRFRVELTVDQKTQAAKSLTIDRASTS